ncbi:retrotransposon protein, putative, ty1-copia subclass [Tanacetum coccineum]
MSRKIKALRSNRGEEYLSIKFFYHLKHYGIVPQLTPPRTPQLNGVAKRRNRILLDMSADEEPIVNIDTQQEVVAPVEPDDISLHIHRTSSRVSKSPQFYYGFHIEEDKISDNTLSELDKPVNYKEAMESLKAAKWKEAKKSKIQSMYDNQV